MQKILFSITGIFIFSCVCAQENKINIASDSLINNYSIRNNLEGQKISGKNFYGTIYTLSQDNMPCIEPYKDQAKDIPNAFKERNNIESNAILYYFGQEYTPLKPVKKLKEEKKPFYSPKKLEFEPLKDSKKQIEGF